MQIYLDFYDELAKKNDMESITEADLLISANAVFQSGMKKDLLLSWSGLKLDFGLDPATVQSILIAKAKIKLQIKSLEAQINAAAPEDQVVLSINQDTLIEANTYLETTRFNSSHEGVRFLINSMKTQYSTDSDIVLLCDTLLSLPVIETTVAQSILGRDATGADVKKALLIKQSELNKDINTGTHVEAINDIEASCNGIQMSISTWDGTGTEPIPYGA